MSPNPYNSTTKGVTCRRKFIHKRPVDETFDIICNSVYKHNLIPTPTLKPNILRKLLRACTTKVNFYDYTGNIYIQINDVSKGNPFGLCFSNYYMSHVNKVFKKLLNLKYISAM